MISSSVPIALAAAALAACTTITVHGVSSAEYLPAQNDDGIVMRFAGFDALFVDPRDEGLRRALGFVPTRLAELPEELGQPVPAEAIRLGLEVLGSPWSLRAGLVPPAGAGDPPNADPTAVDPPPFYAQLTLEGEGGRKLGARVLELMAAGGMPLPEPNEDGLVPLPLDPLVGLAGDVWSGNDPAWAIAVNEVRSDALDLGSLDLPSSVEPVISWKIDFGQYLEGLSMMAGMAGGPLEALSFLDWLDGLTMVGGYGTSSDRAYTTTRVLGYVPTAVELGLMPSGPLRASMVRAIPEDAVVAFVGTARLSGYPALIQRFIGEAVGGGDLIEQVYAETGIHLEHDLFDHLGEGYGLYLSDATGGGGWSSAILFLEVGNTGELGNTLDEMVARGGHLARNETNGYVQLVPRSVGEHDLVTLAFPGLPVPFEVSFGQASGMLFFGLSPQAVVAAMHQASQGGASLLDRPAIRERLGTELAGVYGLTFTDAPRLAAAGYGTTSLLCAALANGTSSPSDPGRYAGAVLPPFQEFMRGVRPSVGVTRVVGDDMVTIVQSDRSILVGIASTMGLIGDFTTLLMAGAPVAGLASAAAVPQVINSLNTAQAGKARADVAQIAQALEQYAVMNGGRYPDSLEVLVTPDANGWRFIEHDTVPIDPWGQVYLYQPPGAGETRPHVYSLGADGERGGTGAAADVSNR